MDGDGRVGVEAAVAAGWRGAGQASCLVWPPRSRRRWPPVTAASVTGGPAAADREIRPACVSLADLTRPVAPGLRSFPSTHPRPGRPDATGPPCRRLRTARPT